MSDERKRPMTEVEIAVLEDLKRFPERILDIRSEVKVVCAKCLTVYPKSVSRAITSFVGHSIAGIASHLKYELDHVVPCSGCGEIKLVEVFDTELKKYITVSTPALEKVLLDGKAHVRVVPPPTRVVKVTQYIVERRTVKTGIFSRKIEERAIVEREYVD